MQEQRSRTAIRSQYRAQRVRARRDRNVEPGTSSQCTYLDAISTMQSCAFRAMCSSCAFSEMQSWCDAL